MESGVKDKLRAILPKRDIRDGNAEPSNTRCAVERGHEQRRTGIGRRAVAEKFDQNGAIDVPFEPLGTE
jgi:hypothetical protein